MADPGWNRTSSPFHAGELAIQARLGVRDRLDRQGRRVIRPVLPEQHREFYGALPCVLVGSVDGQGRPWASVLAGPPGFLATPDERTLVVAARPPAGDPLAANLRLGAAVGLLGIELATRRRNRINGRVAALKPEGFTVQVQQTFGNCPQHIQVRELRQAPASATPPPVVALDRLGAAETALIAAADTFFIATAVEAPPASGMDAARSDDDVLGVDVSHRGGPPGFVQVDDGRTLTIPDFAGNNHFNTLGNLELNPRAGLLFVDFRRGDLLSLTGTAEVVWDGEEIRRHPGAERLLRFHLEQGLWLPAALPLRWSEPGPSPEADGPGV
ncbi:oxidoreductase, FAD-binding [Cyanobium sp. PCC 7001]|uniref:pyridoxamine 5'-phosphate oxidase family protein n=1 Tax=Cyanobium sp. PCC 7001 TaxID=180281 RepID=UPI0001804DBC|nr:pyridoxamine 5'-phosphate oxidase family protein [Cyanobium sp. PCC 7001]EDY39088.1 oxidoreductase, FAD-binding [Cyanobium sp. PCC 7001]